MRMRQSNRARGLSPLRGIAVAAATLALLAGAACSGSASPLPAPPTPRPVPSPVVYRDQPLYIGLGDPSFTALAGATAEFGRLGGAVYRIEMPDHWNGRLVLYMHGYQEMAPVATADEPVAWTNHPSTLRSYLIRNGFAWGASSYSSTLLIPGTAADETAALWDFFVEEHGRPLRTYVMGQSMGGAATNIAAERYGDRYDGALGLCGYAGQSEQTALVADYFVAGAYVAGVTQTEFDTAPDATKLAEDRIFPALADPAKHLLFENILFDLTGGQRPFASEGLAIEEHSNWGRALLLAPGHVAYNSDRTYHLTPSAGVSSDEFNRDVIRITPNDEAVLGFTLGNELTGRLAMPLLTLHTTGDWQVPINQQQILRRRVEAAGKGDLLVQRVIQAAPHCVFTATELERGLEDVMNWVEHDVKPRGDDVFTSDFASLGTAFTSAPRLGSPAAEAVEGAGERVHLSGGATLEGAPVDNQPIWAEVLVDGRRAVCSFPAVPVVGGRYQLTVAGDREMAGCGAARRTVRLVIPSGGGFLYSQQVAWPPDSHEFTFDAQFSTTTSANGDAFTAVTGAALDSSGKPLPPGTKIDAYVGGTLCGSTSLPGAVMLHASPDFFYIMVAGPTSVAGCDRNAQVTFRVNGNPVTQIAANALDGRAHLLDLIVN